MAVAQGYVDAGADTLHVVDLDGALGGKFANLEVINLGVAGYGLGQVYLYFLESLERFETDILREALDSHKWNQTKTADALGITRRVLKIKMDKYGLEETE